MIKYRRSSVSSKFDDVSSLIVGSARGTGLGVEVALHSESATRLSGRGHSLQLSVLLVAGSDPVDSGVVSDRGVGGVHDDHFVVFVGSVLTDPIAVEHSESPQSATDTLLSLGSEVAGGLQLVDTDRSGLSGDDTLGDGSLATASSDTGAVNDVPLFGLEAEFAGLVGTRRVVDASDDGELSVLPSSHSENEVH